MSALDDFKKMQTRENAGAVLLPPHKSDDRSFAQREVDVKSANAEAKANRQKAIDLGLSPKGGRRAVERRLSQGQAAIGDFIAKCLNKNRVNDIVQRSPAIRSAVATVLSNVFDGQRGAKRPPQWFETGAGEGTLQPFQIFSFNASADPLIPDWKIKMKPSTIDNALADSPAQEADLTYLFTPNASGLTYVWAEVTIDADTGVVTDRILDSGLPTPTNTYPTWYIAIGGCSIASPGTSPTCFNLLYGPITFAICLNWTARSGQNKWNLVLT